MQPLLRSLQAWLHGTRGVVCPLAIEPAPGAVFQQRVGCRNEARHPCIRDQNGVHSLALKQAEAEEVDQSLMSALVPVYCIGHTFAAEEPIRPW